jgi:hypothetical protein
MVKKKNKFLFDSRDLKRFFKYILFFDYQIGDNYVVNVRSIVFPDSLKHGGRKSIRLFSPKGLFLEGEVEKVLVLLWRKLYSERS